jgi:hypothetical protein
VVVNCGAWYVTPRPARHSEWLHSTLARAKEKPDSVLESASSVRAQLPQAIVADAEVVGKFVEHRQITLTAFWMQIQFEI